MKRDVDLIRGILLVIESCPEVPPKTLRIESFLDLRNKPEVISMHLSLLEDAGLIEAKAINRNDFLKGFDIERITFAGYEYLDAVRNARVWRNIKERLEAVGGATLDIIKELAVGELKKELNL